MTAIRCEGLSRSYGDIIALNDLNLEIGQGSVFGFLGRNGAGKTTTIRLVTGLAKPTAGDAWVAGVKTTGGDAAARGAFGYLPEEPAFYPWMTPGEYLAYVGGLFDLRGRELSSRVSELLSQMGLTRAAKRKIGGFSRGMRQRLGLAQALLHKPAVLFLDEPTSALDPAGRREVLDLLRELGEETTVFLSSHILADVERVCDTIGIVHEGELLLVAERDELLDRHAQNALVLEFGDVGDRDKDQLVERLVTREWVDRVAQEERGLRVIVKDAHQGQSDLFNFITENELFLVRYEWQRATLEDVFLSLISDKVS